MIEHSVGRARLLPAALMVGVLVAASPWAHGRGFGGGGFRGGGGFGGGGFREGGFGGGGDRFGGGGFGGGGGDRFGGGGGFGGDRFGGAGGGFGGDRFGGAGGGFGGDRFGGAGGFGDAGRGAGFGDAGRGFGGVGAPGRGVGGVGAPGRGVAGAGGFGAAGGAAGRFNAGDFGRYAGSSWGHAGAVTHAWSNGYMNGRAADVRSNFWDNGLYGKGWWAANPAAWRPIGWGAANVWAYPAWGTLAAFTGIAATPTYYDGGTNVVYQDDSVYVNGADAGTQDQYAQQAQSLANQGAAAQPPEQSDQWQSLGVWGLVQGDDKSASNYFQLAIDSNGILRGNYFDQFMGTTSKVTGSVNKQTQRAAWIIGDNKNMVFDTGLANLTKPQTPVLVHIGKDKTQQWLLVRMDQPQAPSGQTN